MTDRLEGKVAAVLDRHTVVINLGSENGVTKGDTFYVYAVLGPFKDPDSGEDLGATEKTISRVQTDTVEDRFCIASTPTQRSMSFIGGTPSVKTSRSELPLSPESALVSGMDLKVKVGSPVFLVPSRRRSSEQEEASGSE